MTNQVNQAFEKWWYTSKYTQVIFHDDKNMRIALDGYQAATQARDSEINSLKQRVAELQADNLRLRDSLFLLNEHAKCYGFKSMPSVNDIVNNALSSTPTQSLAERKEQYEDKLIAQFTDPNL